MSLKFQMTDGVDWPTKTPRPGDRMRAIGRVVRQTNDQYNYAKAFQIETLSRGEPTPPVEVTTAELNDQLFINRVVRLTGTVIDVFRDEIDPRFIFLLISSGSAALAVTEVIAANRETPAAHALQNDGLFITVLSSRYNLS